jgi:hypothetical protein
MAWQPVRFKNGRWSACFSKITETDFETLIKIVLSIQGSQFN